MQALALQFTRFIFVGILSTLINYLIFYTLYQFEICSYMIASGIGFVCGFLSGYSINARWTYKVSRLTRSFFLRYISIYVCSLVTSLFLLHGLVEGFGVMVELANVVVIGVVTVMNFLGTRFWVFSRPLAELRQ